MTYIKNAVELSHFLIKNNFDDNIKACDMTCGNGNDLKFILDEKPKSFVYAFDVQKIAEENTMKLLKDYHNFKFILDNHKNIDKYIDEKLDLFIFNLGYLPKSDKKISTNYKDVIEALKKSLILLNNLGLIIICLYTGHKQGLIESIHIENFLKNLDQKSYQVMKFDFFNQINNPPYLMTIRKLKD